MHIKYTEHVKKQNTDEEREKEKRRKIGGAEGRQLRWLEKKKKKCSNACYMKNQEEPTNVGPRDVVGGKGGGEGEVGEQQPNFHPRDNRARIFRLEGGIHL